MENSYIFWIPVAGAIAFASAITLYSAWNRPGKGRFLCEDCRFNSPQDCLKKERPTALVCTSYRAVESDEAVG